MRISDWSSDVCSSDLRSALLSARGFIGSTALNQPAPCPPSCCRRFRRAGPIRPRARRRCKAQGCSLTSLGRSEEHTSELQSLMRISYAVCSLKKKKNKKKTTQNHRKHHNEYSITHLCKKELIR